MKKQEDNKKIGFLYNLLSGKRRGVSIFAETLQINKSDFQVVFFIQKNLEFV